MAKQITLKERIDRLPELPAETFEVGGKLDFADNIPVVTLRPKKRSKPKRPRFLALAKKAASETRFYRTQALYPRVICYPPGDLVAATEKALFVEGGTRESDRPNADLGAIAQRSRFYKLTKLKGRRLRTALWCEVKYGPWLAHAVEEESCISGAPASWALAIVELPQVALSWFGEWEDMPPFPLLSVIMGDRVLFKVERSCCPGFKFCPTAMDCIPNQSPCPDSLHPV